MFKSDHLIITEKKIKDLTKPNLIYLYHYHLDIKMSVASPCNNYNNNICMYFFFT